MFHSLLKTWFGLVDQWGYAGVFVMMAIESTVFPLPSEVVIPPAAYYAEQGRFHFWGIVMALLSVLPVLGAFVIWLPVAAGLALQA